MHSNQPSWSMRWGRRRNAAYYSEWSALVGENYHRIGSGCKCRVRCCGNCGGYGIRGKGVTNRGAAGRPRGKTGGLWYNILVARYQKGKHEADAVPEHAWKKTLPSWGYVISHHLIEKKNELGICGRTLKLKLGTTHCKGIHRTYLFVSVGTMRLPKEISHV